MTITLWAKPTIFIHFQRKYHNFQLPIVKYVFPRIVEKSPFYYIYLFFYLLTYDLFFSFVFFFILTGLFVCSIYNTLFPVRGFSA